MAESLTTARIDLDSWTIDSGLSSPLFYADLSIGLNRFYLLFGADVAAFAGVHVCQKI